ncbi:MAG TPA: hypothetical protein VGB64_04420 [Actinomycetota bacterium]
MEKSILENLKEGDAVSVALRGGAGWVHGSLAWRRDGMMLLQAADDSVRKETPYVLILLDDVSAIAVPDKVDPPSDSRSPGFNR